jgi:hypothetical protein
MKSISKAFCQDKYEKELIYCSSDPRSLDGVIISANGKKIAVIDSTSPHERDAKIPGATDEIINLGEHFDIGWLTANREAIISKSRSKANAWIYPYYTA